MSSMLKRQDSAKDMAQSLTSEWVDSAVRTNLIRSASQKLIEGVLRVEDSTTSTKLSKGDELNEDELLTDDFMRIMEMEILAEGSEEAERDAEEEEEDEEEAIFVRKMSGFHEQLKSSAPKIAQLLDLNGVNSQRSSFTSSSNQLHKMLTVERPVTPNTPSRRESMLNSNFRTTPPSTTPTPAFTYATPAADAAVTSPTELISLFNSAAGEIEGATVAVEGKELTTNAVTVPSIVPDENPRTSKSSMNEVDHASVVSLSMEPTNAPLTGKIFEAAQVINPQDHVQISQKMETTVGSGHDSSPEPGRAIPDSSENHQEADFDHQEADFDHLAADTTQERLTPTEFKATTDLVKGAEVTTLPVLVSKDDLQASEPKQTSKNLTTFASNAIENDHADSGLPLRERQLKHLHSFCQEHLPQLATCIDMHYVSRRTQHVDMHTVLQLGNNNKMEDKEETEGVIVSRMPLSRLVSDSHFAQLLSSNTTRQRILTLCRQQHVATKAATQQMQKLLEHFGDVVEEVLRELQQMEEGQETEEESSIEVSADEVVDFLKTPVSLLKRLYLAQHPVLHRRHTSRAPTNRTPAEVVQEAQRRRAVSLEAAFEDARAQKTACREAEGVSVQSRLLLKQRVEVHLNSVDDLYRTLVENKEGDGEEVDEVSLLDAPPQSSLKLRKLSPAKSAKSTKSAKSMMNMDQRSSPFLAPIFDMPPPYEEKTVLLHFDDYQVVGDSFMRENAQQLQTVRLSPSKQDLRRRHSLLKGLHSSRHPLDSQAHEFHSARNQPIARPISAPPTSSPAPASSPIAASHPPTPTAHLRTALKRGLSASQLRSAQQHTQQTSRLNKASMHTSLEDLARTPSATSSAPANESQAIALQLTSTAHIKPSRIALSPATVQLYAFSSSKAQEVQRLSRAVQQVNAFNALHFGTPHSSTSPTRPRSVAQDDEQSHHVHVKKQKSNSITTTQKHYSNMKRQYSSTDFKIDIHRRTHFTPAHSSSPPNKVIKRRDRRRDATRWGGTFRSISDSDDHDDDDDEDSHIYRNDRVDKDKDELSDMHDSNEEDDYQNQRSHRNDFKQPPYQSISSDTLQMVVLANNNGKTQSERDSSIQEANNGDDNDKNDHSSVQSAFAIPSSDTNAKTSTTAFNRATPNSTSNSNPTSSHNSVHSSGNRSNGSRARQQRRAQEVLRDSQDNYKVQQRLQQQQMALKKTKKKTSKDRTGQKGNVHGLSSQMTHSSSSSQVDLHALLQMPGKSAPANTIAPSTDTNSSDMNVSASPAAVFRRPVLSPLIVEEQSKVMGEEEEVHAFFAPSATAPLVTRRSMTQRLSDHQHQFTHQQLHLQRETEKQDIISGEEDEEVVEANDRRRSRSGRGRSWHLPSHYQPFHLNRLRTRCNSLLHLIRDTADKEETKVANSDKDGSKTSWFGQFLHCLSEVLREEVSQRVHGLCTKSPVSALHTEMALCEVALSQQVQRRIQQLRGDISMGLGGGGAASKALALPIDILLREEEKEAARRGGLYAEFDALLRVSPGEVASDLRLRLARADARNNLRAFSSGGRSDLMQWEQQKDKQQLSSFTPLRAPPLTLLRTSAAASEEVLRKVVSEEVDAPKGTDDEVRQLSALQYALQLHISSRTASVAALLNLLELCLVLLYEPVLCTMLRRAKQLIQEPQASFDLWLKDLLDRDRSTADLEMDEEVDALRQWLRAFDEEHAPLLRKCDVTVLVGEEVRSGVQALGRFAAQLQQRTQQNLQSARKDILSLLA